MSATFASRRISLVLLLILYTPLSIEAFDLNRFGLRKLKSPLNADKAEEKLERTIELEYQRLRPHDEVNKKISYGIVSRTMPHKTCTEGARKRITSSDEQWSRNQFLFRSCAHLTSGLAVSTAASWAIFPAASDAKLYSENAANLERINNGDFSGGAVFNNSPTTERAAKRRAMTGCKVTMSREEASATILKREKMLSEKECNSMVMDGETEFMLQALRSLDCPTCANGIGRVN